MCQKCADPPHAFCISCFFTEFLKALPSPYSNSEVPTSQRSDYGITASGINLGLDKENKANQTKLERKVEY